MATTTQDDLNKAGDEYSAAFAEEPAAAPEVSEDEAFGLAEVANEDGASDGSSDDIAKNEPAIAVVADEEPPAEVKPDSAAIVVDESEAPTDPADIQREKSWEGDCAPGEAELSRREAELKEKLAALNQRAEGGEPVGIDSPAHEAGEPAVTEALESAVDDIESGKSVDQALQALRDDFGDDFVSMIQAICSASAAEAAHGAIGKQIGEVKDTVGALISELSDRSARAHFKQIQKAHPDFMEVANGDAATQYLASLPEGERQRAEQIIEGGDTDDVIELLNAIKAAGKQTDGAAPGDDESLDAAEGVRSGGLRLPEKPKQSGGYEEAWEEF